MKGQFTKILEIIAEDSAREGDTPIVGIRIKNLTAFTQLIGVEGHVEPPWQDLLFNGQLQYWLEIKPGKDRLFYSQFTMPPNNVIITAYSLLGYEPDDMLTKNVALAKLEPIFLRLVVNYHKGA